MKFWLGIVVPRSTLPKLIVCVVWVAEEEREALEWSRTVKVAVVVFERLDEFGSLTVKEIVLTPRLVEVIP